jgi:hypothetical protein
MSGMLQIERLAQTGAHRSGSQSKAVVHSTKEASVYKQLFSDLLTILLNFLVLPTSIVADGGHDMCRRPHFPGLDCGLEILWHDRWLHLLRWRNCALSHKRVVCRLDSLLQALETRWDNGPRRFQGCILGLCRLFLPTALGTLQGESSESGELTEWWTAA